MSDEQGAILDILEYGADSAISAVIAVAQTSMAQAAVKRQDTSAALFVGFLQALVENREAFRTQIVTKAMVQLETKAAEAGA